MRRIVPETATCTVSGPITIAPTQNIIIGIDQTVNETSASIAWSFEVSWDSGSYRTYRPNRIHRTITSDFHPGIRFQRSGSRLHAVIE